MGGDDKSDIRFQTVQGRCYGNEFLVETAKELKKGRVKLRVTCIFIAGAGCDACTALMAMKQRKKNC